MSSTSNQAEVLYLGTDYNDPVSVVISMGIDMLEKSSGISIPFDLIGASHVAVHYEGVVMHLTTQGVDLRLYSEIEDRVLAKSVLGFKNSEDKQNFLRIWLSLTKVGDRLKLNAERDFIRYIVGNRDDVMLCSAIVPLLFSAFALDDDLYHATPVELYNRLKYYATSNKE